MRHFIYTLIFLVSVGLANFVCGQNDYEANEFIGLLIRLQNPSSSVRIDALNSLKKYDKNKASPILTKVVLQDSNIYISRLAAESLAKFKDKDCIAEFIEATKDPKADVRERAAMALGITKDAASVPSLLSMLEKDNNEDVKLQAIWALGRLHSKEATSSLIQLLTNQNENIKIRMAAVRSLGDIADIDAVTPLVEVFEESPDLRFHIKSALRKIQRTLPQGNRIWQDLEKLISNCQES